MDFNDTNTNDVTETGGTANVLFGMKREGLASMEETQPPLRAVSLLDRTTTGLQCSTDSKNEGKEYTKNSKRMSLESKSRLTSNRNGAKDMWEECSWKVSSLSEIPLDYPLERTRRGICNASITEVVNRISKCLRLLSIEAKFENEYGTAKCITSDMVSFHIQLYAGGFKNQESITVELQRRSGEPRYFLRVCNKILDAADGGQIQEETIPARKKVPLCIMKMPVAKMKCIQGVNKPDHSQEPRRCMNRSLQILRSKEKDFDVEDFEVLCFLTDPLKTRADIVTTICKGILQDHHYSFIRDAIENALETDVVLLEDYESRGRLDAGGKLRRLATILMSNVLAQTSSDGCLANAIQNEKWFADFLIPSLSDEVKNFEVSSNNAYEAISGLNHMAACSEIARHLIKEECSLDDLRSANDFAVHNHKLLASETKLSLGILGYLI
ncbi:unnamed protein product [Pseudo-nitzschia multistriata]|uniref:KA1 domain-containing protein n=1 Tax=Pseudo-nitzschia multistriata TaxID=183589 RepID=A0A448ZF13_9STRA|nr:unnamed protein product [Pseudo-nitzschia multistriata]